MARMNVDNAETVYRPYLVSLFLVILKLTVSAPAIFTVSQSNPAREGLIHEPSYMAPSVSLRTVFASTSFSFKFSIMEAAIDVEVSPLSYVYFVSAHVTY